MKSMRKKHLIFSISLVFLVILSILPPNIVSSSITNQIVMSSSGKITITQLKHSLLIQPLENGSYTAINGTNGQIIKEWTTENALKISQQAVNSLSDGDSLYWYSGSYTFMGCVNVTISNVTLLGEGWNTIFNQNSQITPALFFISGNNVTIMNMKLLGLRSTTSLGESNVPYMSNLVFSNSVDCKALNIYSAFAPYAGIIGRYCTSLSIDSCYAFDNLYNNTENSGGYLDGGYGIGGLNLVNSTITNNWVVDHGLGGKARASGGIELDYNGIVTYGNTVSFNNIITPHSFNTSFISYGIRIKNSNSLILGNNIELPNSLALGIAVDKPNAVIQENTIKSSIYPNSYAIFVTSTGTNPLINNNIIENTAYGIKSQAQGSIITGNTIEENFNGVGIVLSGTLNSNSLISENVILLKSGQCRGIYISTNLNIISKNEIYGTFYEGIYLVNACNNTIIENTIMNSTTGILLNSGSNFNILTLNEIKANNPTIDYGDTNFIS